MLVWCIALQAVAGAQALISPDESAATTDEADSASIIPPTGYVIGPEDVLGVFFWREEEMRVSET